MDNSLESNFLDYEKSFKTFKMLLTTQYEVEAYPPAVAKFGNYGEDFPGSLIHKPQYINCNFLKTIFESSDGALSKFHNCSFDSCFFNNCDLRYCDIFESDFNSKLEKTKIKNCNFSFGNFIKSNFDNIAFSGCSFRQMQLEKTSFTDSQMEYCSFEQSTLKECIFKNLDFRKVGVRYCIFENTILSNVIFHILDIPRNFGLIQQLQDSNESVYVAYQNDKIMSLSEAINYLKALIPYYLETKQFYELINVYAICENYEYIQQTLPIAFKSVIQDCDFSALQDLCSLLVKLQIFTQEQLKDFYISINKLIVPDKFPYYMRKNYSTYIENIKHILVDNPYDNPEGRILLKTDIVSLDNNDMTNLLMSIETNITELAPKVNCTITLTHHSPYEILIVLYGTMPDILMVCQTFYYGLGGIKAFSDLQKSRYEKLIKRSDTNNAKSNQTIKKRMELSFGEFFSFKYEKEFVAHIESLEYNIK